VIMREGGPRSAQSPMAQQAQANQYAQSA